MAVPSRFPQTREAAFKHMAPAAGAMSENLDQITIELNGEPHRIDGDFGLMTLISALKLKPKRIAVEVNREVVPKAEYDKIVLKNGDVVEIINFVGGG